MPAIGGAPLDEPFVRELALELRAATERLAGLGVDLTLLCSGGLDSSTLGWILRERPATSLLTVGIRGAPDLAAGAQAAGRIALPHTSREFEREEVHAALERWDDVLGGLGEPARSVQLSLALAFESTSTQRLLLGQGADELFWGYARFRGVSVEAGSSLAERALERLLTVDLPLTRRLAERTGHNLLLPYLDQPFRRAVARAPAALHLSAEESKPLLRRIARELGVPPELWRRPKRAFQYGSGIARAARGSTRSDPRAHLAPERPRERGRVAYDRFPAPAREEI